jgi:hypothetical protein
MAIELKKDFYRQTINFMVVPEYGGEPEREAYFYDQIAGYADYKAPRAPYEGSTGAQGYILLKHKAITSDSLLGSQKRFVTHSKAELEDMFAEAEYKVERRKPFELQQTSNISLDFLRASLQLSVIENPGYGDKPVNQTFFYDQFVGHGAYDGFPIRADRPQIGAYIRLKNDGCLGTRKCYVTQSEDEIQGLFKDAEAEIENKAIGLLRQLNL